MKRNLFAFLGTALLMAMVFRRGCAGYGAENAMTAEAKKKEPENRAHGLVTDQIFINSLRMKFVPVTGTKVLFSIWETRVQDYETFVNATGHSQDKPLFLQGPTHPAVKVSWVDAMAFCKWLTQKEGREYRLPTEEEWSCAAGTTRYPWGDEWPPPRGAGNYCGQERKGSGGMVLVDYDDGWVETSPVGSFKANAHGLYDIGGNVCEWCMDWFDQEQQFRVLRGASYYNYGPDTLAVAFRDRCHPGFPFPRGSVGSRFVHIGFRVVVVAGHP